MGLVDVMAHEIVLNIEVQGFIFTIAAFDDISNGSFQFILENVGVRISSAVLYHKEDGLGLGFQQTIGGFDDGLENVELASLVAANFVHPNIDDNNIGDGQAQ